MGEAHSFRVRGCRARRALAAWLAAAALAAMLVAPQGLFAAEEPSAAAGATCDAVEIGTWLDLRKGGTIAPDRLLAALGDPSVILLGEVHDNAEHHRWQLYTLAAVYGRRPRLVIGFEAFPRRVQPVLDRWINGELDTEAFLEASEWYEVWGFDPALYLPLFHFARQNRLPMVALNVDRALVSRVGREGWAAVPADARQGLSDPAPASEAYRHSLARVFAEKLRQRAKPEAGEAGAAPAGEPEIAEILERADFARFVAAQQTWDRAMAEALAAAPERHPGSLVVGVMGRGHLEHGHGVPHQLADLGVADAAVLLPVEPAEACGGLAPDLAHAVFVVEPARRIETAAPKPRLGVMIEAAEGGVRILTVLAGSVAEATGLAEGDVVVSAAGFPTGRVAELVEIVQRQAPGTWLPLAIRREGKDLELVAKFPTAVETPE